MRGGGELGARGEGPPSPLPSPFLGMLCRLFGPEACADWPEGSVVPSGSHRSRLVLLTAPPLLPPALCSAPPCRPHGAPDPARELHQGALGTLCMLGHAVPAVWLAGWPAASGCRRLAAVSHICSAAPGVMPPLNPPRPLLQRTQQMDNFYTLTVYEKGARRAAACVLMC